MSGATKNKQLTGVRKLVEIADQKLVGLGFLRMCYLVRISFKVVCKKKKETETTINMFGVGK